MNRQDLRASLRSLGRTCRSVVRLATWSPPPICLTALNAMTVNAGGDVELRQAARAQEYRLPDGLTADSPSFFRRFCSVAMPEEVRCTVPGGRVVGPGVILSPDGQSLARDVSVVFGGAPDDHPLLHAKRIPPARRLRGRTLSIASAGGDSYYHWLIDELPRFLEAAGDHHEAVIGHRGHLAHVAKMIGFTGRLIEPSKDQHFRCDELDVSSLFGITGHPTPEVAALLRAFADRHGLRSPHAPRRRLFVSRSAARVRRLVHESDIWPRLESRGFERLFLETMSWEEQITAFAAAEVVVAPHGAGLANLVFCRPDTRVIELFDRRYLHWCYWQLAAVSGLEYHGVISEGDSPPAHDFGSLGADINVRWPAVAAAL